MPDQEIDVLSSSRQSETISNGATMSTNTKDGFGPSLVDILPIEMIRAVCEHLPQEDITNFRLTSNICATAGMDRLVQDIYVIFTRESFEKLLNISNHPEMSKHVKAIHYDPFKCIPADVYLYNVMSTLISIPNGPDESEPSPEFLIDRDRARGFEAYKKICEEQALMTKSKFSTWVFPQVLPKFRSLKKFIVAGCYSEQADRLNLDYNPMPLWRGYRSYPEDCHKEALVFLAAAATAGTKLEYLRLDMINFDVLLEASIGTNIFSDGPDARHLRYLSLEGMDLYSRNAGRGLKKLLRATSNLEHLSIGKRGVLSGCLDVDWDVITVGLTLPNLKSLQFSFTTGKPSSLIEFLKRHARTLRSLKLPGCYLKGRVVDWAEVFDGIVNHLTLERASIPLVVGLVHTGVEKIDYQAKLSHEYHGHIFEVLLEDRLTHKNLLAKECSLIPSVLWRDYYSYVKTKTYRAIAVREELDSRGLSWRDSDRKDWHLMDFIGGT
ncbi:hypothetical protein EAE96_006316 [Botrytis aclada]|nr:hypothetical protein EAE96_006316 [Botrytis aclada]